MTTSSFYTDGDPNTGVEVAGPSSSAFYVDSDAAANSAAQAAASAAQAAASAAAAVQSAAGTATPLVDGTAAVGVSTKWAHEDHVHPTDTSRAAVTYVDAQVATKADAAATTAALALKAPLASPALTGVPTAPTATVGTNTTQIATTAFVLANASDSFLQAGTGAVSRTAQNKSRDIVSVKDFGAVGDSVADDTAAIAAALAATPNSGTLYFPAGVYKVIGSGSAVATITKPINIVGAGMYGSLILVDTSVPTSRDIFYVLPPNGSVTRGYSFRDLMITSAGNPGRDVLRIDTTQSNTTEIAEFDISRCFFYASGGGYSIHHLNVASNANGGLFNSNIDKNVIFGGIRLDLTGDSIRIRDNIISTANAGISGSQIPGAGNLLIAGNNISGQSGGVVVSQTIGMVIDSNEFEQQATNLEANNSIVDLTNSVGNNDHPIITNNQIQANAGTGNPTLLRIGAATGARVDGNRFGTPAVYVPVLNTAGATGTIFGWNAWPGLGAANVTDAGAGTIYAPNSSGAAVSLLGNATGTVGPATDIALGTGFTLLTGPTIRPTTKAVATATNDNAAAGDLGEYISSAIPYASRISLTNAVSANVTSISLTAGDWDVSGSVAIALASSTNVVTTIGGISTTSATLDQNTADRFNATVWADTGTVPGATIASNTIGKTRISLAATTTVYLVAYAAFTVSTAQAYGTITARRAR